MPTRDMVTSRDEQSKSDAEVCLMDLDAVVRDLTAKDRALLVELVQELVAENRLLRDRIRSSLGKAETRMVRPLNWGKTFWF